MKKTDLEYIASVLKGEPPRENIAPDWYEILGFLNAHRIAGLFYSRAKRADIKLPFRADKLLSKVFAEQTRRNIFMREQLKIIAAKIITDNVACVFPKGSFLSNMKDGEKIYRDGERVSNDIDLIVRPDEITGVANVLSSLGFVQGRYDAAKKEIIPFSRIEILTRRMNRGETAPYVKLTGDPEFPFVEADINFSLGNTPGEHAKLLSDTVDSRITYDGKVTLPVTSPELFFLHLILHQYKESALYFMVERGKDLELYKLGDIYYFWNSGLLNKSALRDAVGKYGIAEETRAVLTQVRELFFTDCFDEFINLIGKGSVEQPHVTDYPNKRVYAWVGSVTERILAFDSRHMLQGISEQSHVK